MAARSRPVARPHRHLQNKAALDNFAQDLKRGRYEVVTVMGHADHFGSTACNQTLSARRAEVATCYLMSSQPDRGVQIEVTGSL